MGRRTILPTHPRLPPSAMTRASASTFEHPVKSCGGFEADRGRPAASLRDRPDDGWTCNII